MGKYIIAVTFVLFACNKATPPSIPLSEIKGETITLTGEEYNSLSKESISNLSLYALQPNGDQILYLKDVDYTNIGNKIKRTPHSRIPDFVNHKVTFAIGDKFIWTPEPARNPELTLPYQIYADYDYSSQKLLKHPQNKISNRLKEKLRTGAPIKLTSVGTSITFGSHTFDNYHYNSDKQTYPHLIARALERLYGSISTITNRSTDGGGVNQIQDLTPILSESPDVVMIELGMNDHIRSTPDIKHYKNTIDNAISTFIEHGIDVLLVGFFQQNDEWELEYPDNTVAFNTVLKELSAKHNICFADIYTAFEKFDKDKLYKDYMGDYMHHPTSFGHQIYYLEIIPSFLLQATTESELLRYIY